MELIIFPEKCTICNLCVLACSFHHEKVFGVNRSSIEVNSYGKERSVEIVIHSQKEGDRLACDGCKGETEPFCIKYCIPKALNIRES